MHHQTIIDFKQLGQRFIFKDPICELQAKKITDVTTVLHQVETFQKQGYYVVGYVSYEASPAFDAKYQVISERLSGEYLAYFTVHETAVLADLPAVYDKVILPEQWEHLESQAMYKAAIDQIHAQIRQGNTYQVNYTTRLKAHLNGDPMAVYERLVIEQGAAYNAYIAHDDFYVLSMSPELFFQQTGQELLTRPMKGTTRRGVNSKTDKEERDWLTQDKKNRAENMMIVDLLRNDMGRVSTQGSVAVDALCTVEQYATVWQMTSTIKSQLPVDLDLESLFKALFPCGSITGAPKIATMSLIKSLEKTPRGVYCGTIGICLPNGDRIFNVAIRTIQMRDQEAIYGVGSGITWDSDWEAEYQEIEQKSAVLTVENPNFTIVTTAKVSQRVVQFLGEHLNRLEEAAMYFAYPFDRAACLNQLTNLLEKLDKAIDYRLRFSLDKYGNIMMTSERLLPLSDSFREANLVQREEDIRKSPFTYFKTSYRPHIPSSAREQIFYSPEGYLQETSIGNLVLEIDGEYYTPPLSIGILDGIYRRQLIQTKQANERLLKKEDLFRASRIYACNSVRGLYELTIADSYF